MENPDKITLFLVDDDMLFLKTLELDFMELANFSIKTFATGELCLLSLNEGPHIIILDYNLDGIDKEAMNGIQTLDKIKEFNSEIPVIMLSSQDKIDVAINCMHHKAVDYVVKSETAFTRLQNIIKAILHYQKVEKELNWYMQKM